MIFVLSALAAGSSTQSINDYVRDVNVLAFKSKIGKADVIGWSAKFVKKPRLNLNERLVVSCLDTETEPETTTITNAVKFYEGPTANACLRLIKDMTGSKTVKRESFEKKKIEIVGKSLLISCSKNGINLVGDSERTLYLINGVPCNGASIDKWRTHYWFNLSPSKSLNIEVRTSKVLETSDPIYAPVVRVDSVDVSKAHWKWFQTKNFSLTVTGQPKQVAALFQK